MTDEHKFEGGCYVVKDGVRTRVEEPTQHHKDGDRAREASGKPIVDDSVEKHAPQAAAAEAESAKARKKGA